MASKKARSVSGSEPWIKEARRKTIKVRECKKCLATVFGGEAECVQTLCDLDPLTPEREAWCLLLGGMSFHAKLIAGKYHLVWRCSISIEADLRRSRPTHIFPEHVCGIRVPVSEQEYQQQLEARNWRTR